VVVVILLLLLATQVVPPGSSSKSTGSALTYSQARPIADRSVASYPGGSWTLLLAAGLDSPTAESIPTNSTTSGTANCTLTLASGLPANLSVSAFTGSRTAGVAPVWEFLYRNSAGLVAVVSVDNGAGSVLGTIGGTTCQFLFGLFSPVPSTVIDSSQAAAAAQSDAATFLSQYPNASAEFGLIGGVSFLAHIPTEWEVVYTTCSVGVASSGLGTRFNATVNATSAQVTFFQTKTNVSCASGGTISLISGGAPLPWGELSKAMRPQRP
jgi:hypothetical protein